MNAGKGWFSIHRKIEEHWIWNKKPFDYAHAWLDLLLLANHKTTKEPYKGSIVEYKRGTVNRSFLFLGNRWGWDRRTVKRFIDLLKNDGMVDYECTTGRTTITIVNYGFYQDSQSKHVQHDVQHDVQPDVQPDVQTMPTYNNVIMTNNENNENNDKIMTNNENNENIISSDKQKKKPTRKTHEQINSEIFNRLVGGYDFSENMRAKVYDWFMYKAEMKKDYKERGAKSLFTEILNNVNIYGEQAVIDAINRTMSNGYQGIVWDYCKNARKQNKRFINQTAQELNDFYEMSSNWAESEGVE